MWSTTAKPISERDILYDHLDVLTKAVGDAEEFSGRGEVFKALNYLTAHLDRQSGLNLFLVGMRNNRQDQLREGLRLIKKHLGVEH